MRTSLPQKKTHFDIPSPPKNEEKAIKQTQTKTTNATRNKLGKQHL